MCSSHCIYELHLNKLLDRPRKWVPLSHYVVNRAISGATLVKSLHSLKFHWPISNSLLPLNLPLRIKPCSECQGQLSSQARSPLYDSLPREHFDTITFQMNKLFTQTFKRASLKGPNANKTRWNLKGDLEEIDDTWVPSVTEVLNVEVR